MSDKLPIYRIFRALLSWIYILWYNPKIIGKENIPTTGNYIIVGNHIHIYDQCNVIVSTKRYIRYMAKKEYFEGGLSWFFKGVGCIPVKRDHKDHDAVEKAIEVLNKNHCLGIFPEGTRNNLKKEKIKELTEKYYDDKPNSFKNTKKIKLSQINYLEDLYNSKIITEEDLKNNLSSPDEFLRQLVKEEKISEENYYNSLLLPFKYGTVAIANKTSSKIIPVAVTGDYKFRSKNLVVRIGRPFSVGSDLDVANSKLRKKMLTLIEENLNNNGK